jgi:hypothetical protein
MPLTTNTVVDGLIEAVNRELEAGNWSQVVDLTAAFYQVAVEHGDAELAELVQDMHWIANDALVHPLDGVMVVRA